MTRKKQNLPVETTSEPTAPTPHDEINPDADLPPEREEPARTWTPRPDPFGIETIRWADGYSISLKESDANREVFIQFGKGARTDQPQNFEAIKKMLKEEHRMYWDPEVQGWAKGLKPGQTPLIKEENRRTRTEVEEAYYKAVALEEAQRGPSLSEYARERSAPIR